MPIISIATSKGGSGKTTLTAGLAAFWHDAGKRVVTIDSDNNRNLTLRLERSGIPCRPVGEEEIPDMVEAAGREADIVLLDVAGALARGMLYAMSAADIVVIPCKPDRNDVVEAARTQDVLRQAERLSRRIIPHAVLLTQVNKRANALDVARAQLDALALPRLPEDAELPLRTAYAEASFTGVPLSSSSVREDMARVAAAVLALGS